MGGVVVEGAQYLLAHMDAQMHVHTDTQKHTTHSCMHAQAHA